MHSPDACHPKAEDADSIAATRARTRAETSLIGLVETVRGFAGLRAVALAAGMTRLAFGSVDFCLETGIQGQGAELDFVRAQLVVESSLAGLAAPVAKWSREVSNLGDGYRQLQQIVGV